MIKSSPAKSPGKITVRDFYESFKDSLQLEIIGGKKGLDRAIPEPSVNRPSLAITGYFKNFAFNRIQLFGAGEAAYLKDQPIARRSKIIEAIIKQNIPCVVVSRSLYPSQTTLALFDKFDVPTFTTSLSSRKFTAQATVLLESKFAPRTLIHGTLIDIKGIGTLICGVSGIGKSECALALIERGHSLVADDVTYCERINGRIFGRSNDLNRGYMECRGIGIINVAELFGIKCVRLESSVDLIVNFVDWKPGMTEERTGLEHHYSEVLDVKIPHIEIPVRPGRDMARLVEVAAMVQALRAMGHDSAKELNDRLIAHMTKNSEK